MAHILAEQDFVVSAFIIHKPKGAPNIQDSRMLMVYHKKLECYLPPGGHIELGETTDHAIEREIAEETGLLYPKHYRFTDRGYKLSSSVKSVADGTITPLRVPWAVEVHPFTPLPGHKHLCFCYLCLASEDALSVVAPVDSGVDHCAWIGFDELHRKGHPLIWPSISEYGLAAMYST